MAVHAGADEVVNVARPAVPADGKQDTGLVGGDDLGVIGDAVAVPVEKRDVAGLRFPADADGAVRIAVIDRVGTVGKAGPASGLH